MNRVSVPLRDLDLIKCDTLDYNILGGKRISDQIQSFYKNSGQNGPQLNPPLCSAFRQKQSMMGLFCVDPEQ